MAVFGFIYLLIGFITKKMWDEQGTPPLLNFLLSLIWPIVLIHCMVIAAGRR